MLIHTEPVVVTIPVGSPLLGCENLNTCFVPYMTEINPGESVIWKNIDSNPHTITSGITTLEETLQNRYYNQEHDDLFDSGMILASQSFQFTFSNQGEYHYYCSVHPWMTGIVSVR
jgi:plastocyanin